MKEYMSEYNTPRVFQILTTIAFLSLSCLMFGLMCSYWIGDITVFELIVDIVGYHVAEFYREFQEMADDFSLFLS